MREVAPITKTAMSTTPPEAGTDYQLSSELIYDQLGQLCCVAKENLMQIFVLAFSLVPRKPRCPSEP